jgi:XTP/dITP diphosphohydrolase
VTATPALLELVEVMDRLRRECPWDREQTHESLVRYLLEETYETLEAIESGDSEHLREELGDLLMQVFFHARIAEEADPGAGAFDIDDVARGIVDKLVRRHPHVFADVTVADADEVERNWERLKADEKQRTAVTEGIPPALPALAYADKVMNRLEKAGRAAPAPAGEGVGERLLALVQEARAAGLDAESELRRATRAWVEAEH